VGWPPLYDWLLSGIILIASFGSPTQHMADVIGAYYPAILGALTVVPIYFIGRELFNRGTGFIAAGLIALMPGEFLGRSLLGFTDHHVAETLLTTLAALFLVLAIKTARDKPLDLKHPKQIDLNVFARPLFYSLLAGLFLGLYLLTWAGGLLFIFVITVYFITQSIMDHLRDRPTDYLAMVGTLSIITATAITLPILPQTWYRAIYLPSLSIAMPTPVALQVISRVMSAKRTRRVYYPLTLAGLGITGLITFYLIDPDLLIEMGERFEIFARTGAALTITEVQPLLFPQGTFSLITAWINFTTGFFLSLISIGILTCMMVKGGKPERSLLVIWSLLMLAAVLGQRRFAYYFAVNVSLLTGYLTWQAFDFIKLRMPERKQGVRKSAKIRAKSKGKAIRKDSFHVTTRQIAVATGALALFFLVFYPNIKPAIETARQTSLYHTPTDAWYNALSWLKTNTPDPFNNRDAYYKLYETPPEDEDFAYPASAYGIMAWWDNGHQITRVSQRIPVSNPFQQGVEPAAQFFTAQNEVTANAIMDDLGARYVVIDDEMASDSRMTAIGAWVDLPQSHFFDVYYRQIGNELRPFRVYYPEYFRSLSVRLYNFDGKGVVPEKTSVITYREGVNQDGSIYRKITDLDSFTTYEEATTYLSSLEGDNHKIVGMKKTESPVPLEPLQNYKLVYSSDEEIKETETEMMPAVKIFEYNK
jgi:dolichyl-diphosphooligosaccharide--protein glycosyltransferase